MSLCLSFFILESIKVLGYRFLAYSKFLRDFLLRLAFFPTLEDFVDLFLGKDFLACHMLLVIGCFLPFPFLFEPSYVLYGTCLAYVPCHVVFEPFVVLAKYAGYERSTFFHVSIIIPFGNCASRDIVKIYPTPRTNEKDNF